MFTLRPLHRAALGGAPLARLPALRAASSGSSDASSARLLLGTAEAHLEQAARGLREAGDMGRRGAQAQQLARLSQALAPQATQLLQMAQALPVDPQDPLYGSVRQRLATAVHVQALLTAGAAYLRAHAAGQGPDDVPALEADWRQRLCEDAQVLLHRLSASTHPQDQALAGLALACTPGPIRPALMQESLPVPVHRQADQWRLRQGPEALAVTHWLALRLFAHPDSGAAATLWAQEQLLHLDPDMAEVCAPLLSDLARQHVVAVAAAARLPGLAIADPSARYHLALPAGDLPHLDEVLQDNGEWLLGRPLSARREALPLQDLPGGGDPAREAVSRPGVCWLCLQSRSASAGSVRGLRMDLFHPPQALARAQVLLMPGQVFRVGEDGEEEVAGAGAPLRLRRFRLDKLGEEMRHPLPGTLAPGALPAGEPWQLARTL